MIFQPLPVLSNKKDHFFGFGRLAWRIHARSVAVTRSSKPTVNLINGRSKAPNFIYNDPQHNFGEPFERSSATGDRKWQHKSAIEGQEPHDRRKRGKG